jgi:hypothetical protein
MKNFNALILAFAMMFSGSAFAADPVSSAGGASVGDVPKVEPASVGDVAKAEPASVGDVPKAEPASCPCGKNPDGTVKWCPCGVKGTDTSSVTISTTAVVTGIAVAAAIGLAAGHSSSTTQH